MELTAVDWLVHQLNTRKKPLDNSQIDMLFEEAKAMEKEQIIKALERGIDEGSLFPEDITLKDAEEYYNETYNK
jgi:hypothetical protein